MSNLKGAFKIIMVTYQGGNQYFLTPPFKEDLVGLGFFKKAVQGWVKCIQFSLVSGVNV